jgi:hypothetical protein
MVVSTIERHHHDYIMSLHDERIIRGTDHKEGKNQYDQ